ncbi:MAG: hypothetical protein HJJLKODD_00090 [Phycisphaerae bacterium]|nr:hypothetical protein [Phycisphaerae bacterium]
MTWRQMIWGGYALLLIVSTHLPPSRTIPLPGHVLDKVAHFLCYTLLSLLFYWAWRGARAIPSPLMAAGWLAWVAIDEWTQSWVDRSPDFNDWLADACGLLFGWGLYQLTAAKTRP